MGELAVGIMVGFVADSWGLAVVGSLVFGGLKAGIVAVRGTAARRRLPPARAGTKEEGQQAGLSESEAKVYAEMAKEGRPVPASGQKMAAMEFVWSTLLCMAAATVTYWLRGS